MSEAEANVEGTNGYLDRGLSLNTVLLVAASNPPESTVAHSTIHFVSNKTNSVAFSSHANYTD
jgi:hypothetical protein